MGGISFMNRTVVITGAGRGLGRTYALDIAKRGGNVVVNDLGSAADESKAEAEKVVEEIRALGGNAIAEFSDISTEKGGQAAINAAVENFGRIDALINNAGILRDASLAKITADQFNAVVAVHLNGSFYTTKAAFPIMKAQGYGRFVFTTSAAGLFGNFGQANYAAAKMGLVGLSNVVGVEGAKSNILSNVIAPGAKTRMTEGMGALMDALPPEQVTPMVTYLASKACSTTQNIYSVGGGSFARIFVGVAPGWFGQEGRAPTAEEIEANFDKIDSQDGYIVPKNVGEEAALLKR